MDTQTIATTQRRDREVKNRKFANDGSFESVTLQLQSLAIKCFRRVEAMGLPMTIEDVRQEMNLNYIKARNAWKPDGGARFSTYCQWVCLNNFNAAIKRMANDRKELGLVAFSDMAGTSEEGEVEEDPLNRLESLDAVESPEAVAERRQELALSLKGLSAGARRLVNALLAQETGKDIAPVRLGLLAKQVGLAGPELRQVKIEILRGFGVKWH